MKTTSKLVPIAAALALSVVAAGCNHSMRDSDTTQTSSSMPAPTTDTSGATSTTTTTTTDSSGNTNSTTGTTTDTTQDTQNQNPPTSP